MEHARDEYTGHSFGCQGTMALIPVLRHSLIAIYVGSIVDWRPPIHSPTHSLTQTSADNQTTTLALLVFLALPSSPLSFLPLSLSHDRPPIPCRTPSQNTRPPTASFTTNPELQLHFFPHVSLGEGTASPERRRQIPQAHHVYTLTGEGRERAHPHTFQSQYILIHTYSYT